MIEPNFSPLDKCLVVDSSFGSRDRLIRAIKATCLFEHIIEAKSLKEARLEVKYKTYDACFVGPTISQDISCSFLHYLEQYSPEDCARIALISKNQDPELYVYAHTTTIFPSSIKLLSERIIQAVLLASKDSPWPGIKLSDDGNIMVLQGSSWKIISSDGIQRNIKKQSRKFEEELGGMLKVLISAIEANQNSLFEVTLRSIIEAAQTNSTDPFFETFSDALQSWQKEKTYLGDFEATLNFKTKLFDLQAEWQRAQ